MKVSCCSCQPCMHSFCAGCYSDWMERSTECPSVCNFPLSPTTRCNILFDRVLLFFQCRQKVKCVRKNHILNNLVEIFLKAHPNKQRSLESIKELDAKNKIKADVVGLVMQCLRSWVLSKFFFR